jgi:hypothetical protein
MTPLSRRSPLLVALAATCALSTPLVAQPALTAVSSYNTTSTGNAIGSWYTTTQGGQVVSNTYITYGSNPATDAFLFNGNAAGPLLGSGFTLGTGLHNFTLWGFTGYQPNHGVSLAFNGAVNPQVASWYSPTGNTLSAVGTSIKNDTQLSSFIPGVGLSTVLGDYAVTITNFSFAQVERNVVIGSFAWSDIGFPILHNVGQLQLQVDFIGTQPPPPVPEPATITLLAAAMGGLLLGVHRRRVKRAA